MTRPIRQNYFLYAIQLTAKVVDVVNSRTQKIEREAGFTLVLSSSLIRRA